MRSARNRSSAARSARPGLGSRAVMDREGESLVLDQRRRESLERVEEISPGLVREAASALVQRSPSSDPKRNSAPCTPLAFRRSGAKIRSSSAMLRPLTSASAPSKLPFRAAQRLASSPAEPRRLSGVGAISMQRSVDIEEQAGIRGRWSGIIREARGWGSRRRGDARRRLSALAKRKPRREVPRPALGRERGPATACASLPRRGSPIPRPRCAAEPSRSALALPRLIACGSLTRKRLHENRSDRPADGECSAAALRRNRADRLLADRGTGPPGTRRDAVRERRFHHGRQSRALHDAKPSACRRP